MRTMFGLISTILLTSAHAAPDVPTVGLLEYVPVVRPDMQVLARPTYIFTNAKLTTPTMFTGLQSHGDQIGTICCYVVSDLKTISLRTELSRYAASPDYTEHMKSIKGYAYIYATHPAPKSYWNEFMKTITQAQSDPTDGQIFSAPVIASTIQKAAIPDRFEVNQKKVSLKTSYKNNPSSGSYSFIVDGHTFVFSENLPSAE